MNHSNRVRKVFFLSLLFLVALFALFVVGDRIKNSRLVHFLWSAAGPHPPNIVLIVLDTLRADHLSQYGYNLDTSPGLDRLSSSATIFEKAYSTSSWTVPATASIHSGLHPQRHGTTQDGDTLNTAISTIAEQLKLAGYETAGFSDNLHISRKTDFDQGFDTFFDFGGKDALAYPDISRMMTRVKSWVERHENAKRPFFLYMHPMNCHGPYRVPKAAQKTLLSRRPSRRFKYYGSVMADIMFRGKTKRRKEVSKKYLESLFEQYDTAVRYSTDQLGRFLSFLSKKGFDDDTMVILTADHGEELFDHGGFSHGYSLFDEVVRVPLVIRLPRQRQAHRVKNVVSVMDIYPTIIDIVDNRTNTATDGHSLLPFFKGINNSVWIDTGGGEKLFRNRSLVLALNWERRGIIRGWVNPHYKYLNVEKDYSGRRSKKLLFELSRDPHEKKSVAKQNRKKMRHIERTLEKRWEAYVTERYGPSTNRLKEMNVEALKALGYIQ